MGMIVFAVLLVIITSFCCSLAEAALYTMPPSRIESMRRQGSRSGQILANLKADIDKPIAAILILNTVSNSAGAVWIGALASDQLGSRMLGIFTALLTLGILLAGEIIPKTIGAVYATSLAPKIALPLTLVVQVLSPLVWLCRGVTSLLRHGSEPHVASEDDILAMALHGAQHGALLPEEAQWVANALRLNEVTARDLMTPRTVVYVLPSDLPLQMVEAHSAHWKHSRLPCVKDDAPDQVEGIVHRRDVFDRLVAGQVEGRLRDLMYPAVFVPETMTANRLLKTFITERQHLAIVVDEFGGMEGVVTLEDVLEELLGEEIVDEHDEHVDMREFARKKAERRRQAAQRAAAAATMAPPPGGGAG